MNSDPLADATKDELVLAMLAAMGGEGVGVNERDLFLACWHAFPATMRWVDTALPNPDTFTAALRRLDQRGYITRPGKQKRRTTRSRGRRKTVLDPGRAGVVKARIPEGGLAAAGLRPEIVEAVGRLRPDPAATGSLSDAAAIAICVGIRERAGRDLEEGALVELAFHRFPDRFAYGQRPEFPDVEWIRKAIAAAREEGLLGDDGALTDDGRRVVAAAPGVGEARVETSQAPPAGELRFADRIERSPAFAAYAEHGTLLKTKPDELYRALRVPPTADPQPVANALSIRVRGLRRIDRGDLARYLLAIAARHNRDALDLFEEGEDLQDVERDGGRSDG